MKAKVLFFSFALFVFYVSTNAQLKKIFSSNQKPIKINLSNELLEISGITSDEKGELFCHNDEQGIIYKLDIISGKITGKIFIGENSLPGDYEDIAYAHGYFYLLRSDGLLLKITKDKLGKNYFQLKTGLSIENNCEGLYFDEESNSLLIACKGDPVSANKKFKEVYKFSLANNKLDKQAFLKISLDKLKKGFGIKDFYPSAITKNKQTNTFYILSAKGKPAIIEIDSSSNILDAILLEAKQHPKPEGLLIMKDKLFISDEGVSGRASISVYSSK